MLISKNKAPYICPQKKILLGAPRHFNLSRIGSLVIFDNNQTRVCYSCKGFFKADKVLSEYLYKGVYKQQLFYCTACGYAITNRYIEAAGALKKELPTTSTPTEKFDNMTFWELVNAFKRVPSNTILPYLQNQLHRNPLPKEEQKKLLKIPIKIQQTILKYLHPSNFDADTRNKMLLNVLRAYGKRNRKGLLELYEIPEEVVRQLKPLTILRVLENLAGRGKVPASFLSELSGKFFPTILKEGPYTNRVKALIRKLQDNATDKYAPEIIVA